jgi:hypothetical protein
MNYNHAEIPKDVTDESGVFEEPVSIDETKDYLRLEGYTDTDESTADDLSEFDFDDPLIADCNKAARLYFEKTLNRTIIPKTLECSPFTNLCGMNEIPGAPIGEIISLFDEDGNEITSDNYKVIGNSVKYLKYPCYANMTLTYEAGYDVCPEDLRLDIKRLAAYMYNNRGDDPSIKAFASQLANKYARGGWLA